MKRRVMILLTAAGAALALASAAWAIRFTDESYFPPTGVVGAHYSFTFGGAGGCGPAPPYQFTIIRGALPPGPGVGKSGPRNGTPTPAGRHPFLVNLRAPKTPPPHS